MILYFDENKSPQVVATDISKIVGSVNNVHPDTNRNVTITLDEVADGTTRKLKYSTIYYGIAELNGADNKYNIEIDGFNITNINKNMLLPIQANSDTSLTSNFTDCLYINGTKTTYHIIDSHGNPVSYHDIMCSNYMLFTFNGNDFILLTKQYLLDSYTSKSTDYGATANSVKTVYDHFTDIIGDIPAVIDSINRKAV